MTATDRGLNRRLSASALLTDVRPLAALPDRVALLGESAGTLELVLARIQGLHGRKPAVHDLAQGVVELHVFRFAHHFLDGRVDQRRAGLDHPGDLPGTLHQLVGRHHLVDETPAMSFLGLQPATGQQHLHRDVIGDTFRQLDRRRIGHGAGADLRQRERRMVCREDDVGAERNLQAAAAADAVDRRDHRLVEILELLHAAESADPVRAVGGFTGSGRLQVPARGEELLASARDNGDPEARVVAEVRKYLSHRDAGRTVDGVRFRPVDDDLEYPAVRPCPDVFFAHDHPSFFVSSGRSSARLMMWRCISEVPSQMRSRRASRQMRSSGSSSIRPMPPWICIASSATNASISVAFSFAMAMSASVTVPWSYFQPASRIISSAAFISVAMSASLNEMPWNLPMGCLNCSRCEAYSTEWTKALSARPRQVAPTCSRVAPSQVLATWKPSCTSPSTFSAGI